MATWFFPVQLPVETIVRDWIDELRGEHLFGPDDPLFPQTMVGLDNEQHFGVLGISRSAWKTASPVRQIFKAACTFVGLLYFKPQGFRHALAGLGMKLCRTAEELKAWSQHLGHDKPLNTFNSYGKAEPARQADIIRGLQGDPLDLPINFTAEVRQLLLKLATRTCGTS